MVAREPILPEPPLLLRVVLRRRAVEQVQVQRSVFDPVAQHVDGARAWRPHLAVGLGTPAASAYPRVAAATRRRPAAYPGERRELRQIDAVLAVVVVKAPSTPAHTAVARRRIGHGALGRGAVRGSRCQTGFSMLTLAPRLLTSCFNTALTCHSSTPGNHSRKSFTVDPAARLANVEAADRSLDVDGLGHDHMVSYFAAKDSQPVRVGRVARAVVPRRLNGRNHDALPARRASCPVTQVLEQ